MTKQKPIKAVKAFARMTAEVVLSTSVNIYDGIFNNPNFTAPQAPAPPVDSATLKSANDSLATANAEALDGGKKALAQKAHAKEVVVKLLQQLAVYVQANCKDDMTIFLSSGFTAVSSGKTASPPASDSIRKVEPGEVSGQMRITLMKYPGAVSYEVRWAPAVAGGNPGTWANQPVAYLRPATTISGLTPGTTYQFQVRAVIKAGYSDWSDSVTRMAV
jgi:Fibronectin type III domain